VACKLALAHVAEGQPRPAIETLWAALDLDKSDLKVKGLLVRLLKRFPSELASARRSALLDLLTDQEVEPLDLCAAGWSLVIRDQEFSANALEEASLERLAEALGGDELAMALLRAAEVYPPETEQLLTGVRRWLLLSGKWHLYLGLVSALATQARLNGGAWPFDDVERAHLYDADEALVAVYLPRGRVTGIVKAEASSSVTRAVTMQYEGWPYPPWTRINRPPPVTLPDRVRAMCALAAENLPVDANILVAGCGTGRQAAYTAAEYPDATITAIDVSRPSLDYARRQCSALGFCDIQFLELDLNDAAQLDQRFDAILCGGVLHHLPDPERGLGALLDVLRPGGVMEIMVYSCVARLPVDGARTFIRDLVGHEVNDDLLREVRSRLLSRSDNPLVNFVIHSMDFPTLSGTYDLLLHEHEDPFDIPRIKRAVERFGLRVLSFDLPLGYITNYDTLYPTDQTHINLDSLHAFEMRNPTVFTGHYSFWCSKQ
jgi:SAM-dependent methyltransferase